jgi:hypothetical protein
MVAMLTVMSGMYPHIISWNLGWIWLSLGLVLSKWILLCCGSVMVRLHDAIEIITLKR